MNKKVFLALALVTVLAMTGCENETTEQSTETTATTETAENATVGMVNPMVSYDTLDEINTQIGAKLSKPPVMGVSEEAFFVINGKVAQYNFKLNGYEYTFRAANQKDDISGIYENGKLIFADNNGTYKTVTVKESKSCQFFVGDMQYVLTVSDNGGMKEESFKDICDEMKSVVEVKEGK